MPSTTLDIDDSGEFGTIRIDRQKIFGGTLPLKKRSLPLGNFWA
jgi:hypothetical protein